MKPVFKLNFPTDGFSFKPVVPKQKRNTDTNKPLTKILYCVAKETEDGSWKAHVNTRGLEGYEDVTILDFTEESFDLKDVNIVFRKENGITIQQIRTDREASMSVNRSSVYCTLCKNCVYSGHIVKVNGNLQFDMSVYKGTRKQCEVLINMSNKNIKENEEEQ